MKAQDLMWVSYISTYQQKMHFAIGTFTCIRCLFLEGTSALKINQLIR